MWIYLNDRFVKKEHARVSVFDHGFLYGDGVYETLRAYHGRIFLLERHVARLHRSCELIGLELPIENEAWISILGELLARNSLRNAGLRVTVSRGEGEMGIDPRCVLTRRCRDGQVWRSVPKSKAGTGPGLACGISSAEP